MQPVFIRNSERSTYRRCRLKWHWAYNHRLAPERQKGALSFGTLVHEALAAYYPPGRKRGPKPAVTFEKLYAQQKQSFAQWDDDGEKIDAGELGVAMLEGYVKEYGKDDAIEVIAPEMPLRVDIHTPGGKYLATWVGRGDALVRDLSRSRSTGSPIVMLEHKTAKTIESELGIISGYGEQGLSYWYAATIVMREQGILPPDVNIDGVVYNWLRKALPDERPKNHEGHALNKPKKEDLHAVLDERGVAYASTASLAVLRELVLQVGIDPDLCGQPSSRQPQPLFERYHLDFGSDEHKAIEWRIRMDAWEMIMARKGELPITKNPTKDCKWDCPFKDPCEVHEMGGDYEAMLNMEFITWSPYEEHELQEEKG